MNASSESGLWATWMVVIGEGEGSQGSLRCGACRGDRPIDVVPVQEVLGQRGRAFGRLGGEQARIERTGADVVPFHARRASSQDEPEQMRRSCAEDGIRLRARERGVASDLAQPPQIVALVEGERIERLVDDAC